MPVPHKVAEAAVTLPPDAHFVTGENLVYLMGLSFIIGSLFTIFILIVLDFMQRDRIKQ